MIKHKVVSTKLGTSAVLCDSVSFVTQEDAGLIIVCASHGGSSAGFYAAELGVGLIIFNDAGVGKDDAGIESLSILQKHGVAACTVSYRTARIGDVIDQWENGVISYSNGIAGQNIASGMTVQQAVDSWAQRLTTCA